MKHPTSNPLSFFFHALLSLASGAFVAGATGGIQLLGSGSTSASALLLAGFSAFATYFGAGFVMLEKSPQTQAALGQAGQELLSRVDQLQVSHGTLISRIEAALVGLRLMAGATQQAQPAQAIQTSVQPLVNTTAAQQIGVPQQPFPGQSLNWTGVVPVPAQQ